MANVRLASALLLALMSGCGTQPQGEGMDQHDGNAFERPEEETAKQAIQDRFSESGGELAVDQPGSVLHGITVSVPAGALAKEDVLTLSAGHASVRVRDGKWLGTRYTLDTAAHTQFEKPVEVTVPLPPEWAGRMVLPYNVDGAGKLHVMNRRYTDDGGKSIIVSTWKPCTFTLVGLDKSI